MSIPEKFHRFQNFDRPFQLNIPHRIPELRLDLAGMMVQLSCKRKTPCRSERDHNVRRDPFSLNDLL